MTSSTIIYIHLTTQNNIILLKYDKILYFNKIIVFLVIK